jgi:hypothetical protein
MIDADDTAPFVLSRVRQHGGQVDDGNPVVFVVVGEERDHRFW